MPSLPDLSGLGRVLQLFVAVLGAYLFAVWVSMLIWTYRDIRARSRDVLVQLFAVALVIVFNIFGLLLYFILRPRETLAEKYERELAEEAMLQDIEERQVCPVCHHKIMAEYLICPNCHTSLHKKCENCGRVLNLKWNVCPYCAKPQAVPAAHRPAAEMPPPPPMREWKREPVTPTATAPVAHTKTTTLTPASDSKPDSTAGPKVQSPTKPLAPPETSS